MFIPVNYYFLFSKGGWKNIVKLQIPICTCWTEGKDVGSLLSGRQLTSHESMWLLWVPVPVKTIIIII